MARPMPRLDPVTRMVSATRGLREHGADVARAIRLERALGHPAACDLDPAFVRREIRRVAHRELREHVERRAENEGVLHAAIIPRADQQSDRRRLAALDLLDA